MSKLKVAVLFGGMSSEHDISLQSAYSVLSNMDKDKYEIIPIGITKSGRWLYFPGNYEDIKTGEWKTHPDNVGVVISPDRTHHGIIKFTDGSVTLQKIDVVFPVLHGKYGEDGTVQGLLELSGIPYVGCDNLSSAVCMDKATTHSLLDSLGIPNAKWTSFKKYELRDIDAIVNKIESEIPYPVFVKPAKQGSSVGVSKATCREELILSVKTAFSFDDKIVVEETLFGKEVECAVMGNTDPVASVLGEILPKAEFYDYDAKYITGDTGLLIPASLPENVADKVRSIAIRAYKGLGCTGLARVDFFATDDGIIRLNEPNTLPGFTSISMYPKLFVYGGMKYSEVIDKLISLGLERVEN